MKKLLLGIMCAVSIGTVYGEALEEKERREIANSISFGNRNPFFTSKDSFNYNQWKHMSSNDGSFGQTNSIYRLLKSDYGLNENVQCTKYVAHTYSDEKYRNIGAKNKNSYANTMVGYAKKQELGVDDERTIWMTDSVMTLNRDLAFVLKVVADQNEKNPEHSEQKYVEQREVILRFIGKSCGAPFTNAFNQFLGDFGQQVKVAYQIKVDQEQAEEQKELQAKQVEINRQNELRRESQTTYSDISKMPKSPLEQCRASKKYALYEAQNGVVIGRESIRNARAKLAQDDQAARIGGVSNQSLRYSASNQIINSTSLMNQRFAEYKKLGGTAKSPVQVVQPVYPCK